MLKRLILLLKNNFLKCPLAHGNNIELYLQCKEMEFGLACRRVTLGEKGKNTKGEEVEEEKGKRKKNQ